MGRILSASVALLAALVAAPAAARVSRESPAPAYGEYEVKAALMRNIIGLVEWPRAAFEAPDSALRLCVLGDDPFGALLERAFEEYGGDRPVVIERFATVRQMKPCQLMFISASEARRTSRILESLWGSPVLTVGETPGFARSGGIVQMWVEDRKVRLEINTDAAERAGIRIDRRLLELAASGSATARR
jgi:hypothetical protein